MCACPCMKDVVQRCNRTHCWALAMSKPGSSSTEDWENWKDTSVALLSWMVSYTFLTFVPAMITAAGLVAHDWYHRACTLRVWQPQLRANTIRNTKSCRNVIWQWL